MRERKKTTSARSDDVSYHSQSCVFDILKCCIISEIYFAGKVATSVCFYFALLQHVLFILYMQTVLFLFFLLTESPCTDQVAIERHC